VVADHAFVHDGVAPTCAAEAGMLAVAMQVLRVRVVSRKALAINENRITLGANVLIESARSSPRAGISVPDIIVAFVCNLISITK
jgi:hypothetical protein